MLPRYRAGVVADGETALARGLRAIGWKTVDGSPVSREAPFGVTVVVSRPGADAAEFLVLHRGHRGPEYGGEWAWGPPAGARLPGEEPAACARRELLEETGLALVPALTDCGTEEWLVFAAVAPAGAEVRLSAEHDAYAWLELAEAAACCRPASVADQLRAAATP